MLRETLEVIDRSLLAKRYISNVLAMEACDDLYTRDKAERLIPVFWAPLRGHDGHLSSTWYCWRGVSRKTPSQTLPCFPILRRTRLCLEKPLEIFVALFRQRNTCILCWPLEAFESLNTQGQAGLLMALRRHYFEDMIAWYCQQRGHADTLWYPHFFSPVTFEPKRLTSEIDTADPCYGQRHCDV